MTVRGPSLKAMMTLQEWGCREGLVVDKVLAVSLALGDVALDDGRRASV